MERRFITQHNYSDENLKDAARACRQGEGKAFIILAFLLSLIAIVVSVFSSVIFYGAVIFGVIYIVRYALQTKINFKANKKLPETKKVYSIVFDEGYIRFIAEGEEVGPPFNYAAVKTVIETDSQYVIFIKSEKNNGKKEYIAVQKSGIEGPEGYDFRSFLEEKLHKPIEKLKVTDRSAALTSALMILALVIALAGSIMFQLTDRTYEVEALSIELPRSFEMSEEKDNTSDYDCWFDSSHVSIGILVDEVGADTGSMTAEEIYKSYFFNNDPTFASAKTTVLDDNRIRLEYEQEVDGDKLCIVEELGVYEDTYYWATVITDSPSYTDKAMEYLDTIRVKSEK